MSSNKAEEAWKSWTDLQVDWSVFGNLDAAWDLVKEAFLDGYDWGREDEKEARDAAQ